MFSIYQAVKEGTFKKAEPTGSKYICSPSVEDTDEDWIILVDDLNTTYSCLDKEGFIIGGSFWVDDSKENKNNNYWWSFKKSNLNLIITDCEKFFNDFVLATYVAKKLNLLKKEDRVTLFQAILYRNRG